MLSECNPSVTITIHVAVYVLVRYSKKNAARCDTHCELYDSVNRSNFERIMYCRNISERVSVSVAITFVWEMREPSMSVWFTSCDTNRLTNHVCFHAVYRP